MAKDPIFELIVFYWLSGLSMMFGLMLAALIIGVVSAILSIPIKLYRNLKSKYDERKVQP